MCAKNNQNTATSIAALQAQIAALQNQAKEEKRGQLALLGKELDKLPGMLAVANLEEVLKLIRRHQAGKLAVLPEEEKSERKTRVVHSEEEKIGFVARVMRGGPGNSRDEVRMNAGVAYGTFQNWLSDVSLQTKAIGRNLIAGDTTAAPATVSKAA